MEKETFMQMICIICVFALAELVSYFYKVRDQKIQDRRVLMTFIVTILARFNNVSSRGGSQSKACHASSIKSHIRNCTSMELYVLMTRTKSFPRKCDYPLVDSSTNNLVNEIFTLLVDLHFRYKKKLIDMDDLTDEFYQKLEGYILKLL